ncbi:MAG: hypothetical protein HKO66_13675 [Saprospiraceae bacterium]|nr:hypothetical protein [Bacteroidia bacterium]NNE14739.1 hypothetical protein [Saprospiraceae bacterium]NNL93284.1 hypothetical protein [Saprospiraceae bacterium]
MSKQFLISILGLCLFSACVKDKMPELIELDQEMEALIKKASPTGQMEYYILPDENDLSAIQQDQKNLLTPERVELGKFLFYETGFAMGAVKESGKGTYSCATCHIPEAGFRPGNFQGIADGGQGFGLNGEDRRRHPEYVESELDVQSARPLSLANVAFVKNTFWNGQFGARGVNEDTEAVWDLREDTERNHLGFEAIETQNFEGIESHRYTINEELIDAYGYRSHFDSAYPELVDSLRYSNYAGALALSAYIRTILTNKAPFQNWLKGQNSALGYDEKKGAILFFGKANCSNCHYEENLGSLEFHALGVKDMDQSPSFNAFANDRRNFGRGGFTLRPEDNFKFKVPGIYNVGDAPFYFHGASKRNLKDLIDYKNLAQTENERVDQSIISEKFLPLGLTEEEKLQLIAFIEKALRDPEMERYAPESLLSGFCFPNNDAQSRIDLGCN